MLPSVKVPVALNCWVAPTRTVGFTGETAREAKAAVPTVKVVVADIVPDVAVMTEVPAPALVARPLLPDVLLIIATFAEDELQVTTEVIGCVLPSL